MWRAITRDLQEFVTVVKTDTTGAISTAIAKPGSASPSAEGEIRAAAAAENDGPSAAVRLLRADLKTFTEPIPSAEQVDFEAFLEGFDLQSEEQSLGIAELLGSDERLSSVHTELVPQSVSYESFWTRYFFRLSQLPQSALQATIDFGLGDEDVDLSWDVGDEDGINGDADDSRDDGAAGQRPSPGRSPVLASVRQEMEKLRSQLMERDEVIWTLRKDRERLASRVAELEEALERRGGAWKGQSEAELCEEADMSHYDKAMERREESAADEDIAGGLASPSAVMAEETGLPEDGRPSREVVEDDDDGEDGMQSTRGEREIPAANSVTETAEEENDAAARVAEHLVAAVIAEVSPSNASSDFSVIDPAMTAVPAGDAPEGGEDGWEDWE